MKINIIVPFTYLTGGIRVIFLYANYLQENGYDVCVYVPMLAYKFNDNLARRVKMSLINTIKRGRKVEWIDIKFKIKLVPAIKDLYIRQADFIIATAWPTANDINNLKYNKGKKIYFIQDYEIWSGNVNEVDKTFLFPFKRIVITKSLQDLLKYKFNVDSTIIYNGLNKDEFLIGNKKLNDTKTILMLYNEAANKGTLEGIKILKEIQQKNKVNIKMFGFIRGSIEIPDSFEFYENPSRKELMDLYKESDIYLFTSKHEAWGLPVMEAMANKCAVVGNKVGCLSEIVENNYNALVVNNCDYNFMKLQVEKLLNDEELLKSIQENGYKLAKKYEWSNSFNKFEEMLKNNF